MATVQLTQANFEPTLQTKDIMLIDFWAEWCGPCRRFGPIFEAVSEKHPDITFAKCDTEAESQLAGAFGIQSIPTLAVFRDKVLVFMQPGLLPESSLEQLIEKVKELDMDAVREQIRQHEEAHAHGGCEGCGHDHGHSH